MDLTQQLPRYAGHFYKLRSYVARETLCMLYYTLVYSKIQYRIIVWATANKTSLGVLKVKLNKISRIILSFNSLLRINTDYSYFFDYIGYISLTTTYFYLRTMA